MKIKISKNDSPFSRQEAERYLKRIGLLDEHGPDENRILACAIGLAGAFCAMPDSVLADEFLLAEYEGNAREVHKNIRKLFHFYEEPVPLHICAMWTLPDVWELFIRHAAEELEVLSDCIWNFPTEVEPDNPLGICPLLGKIGGTPYR